MSRRPRPGLPVARILGVLLLLFFFASGPAAEAQGLGDAAERERERRHKEPTAPARVLTNEDLPKAAPESTEAEGGEGEGEASTALAPEGSLASSGDVREQSDREREERVLLEREWRARFAEARAKLREAEARGWRDVVRTDFYQGIPVQLKVKEFVETVDFRQAKKDLADLEEEFRRTGHPPGWARE